MAGSSPEGRSIRWGRVAAVLVALFLVTEAGAQAYFIHWTGKPYGSVFLYLWSPYGLVRNNPRLTGNFSISPEGFREVRRYDQKKPPNTFRVILLGGSVLYSGSTGDVALGYVPSDQTISQGLAARLRADPAFQGRDVEVINAGVNYNRITEVSSGYLADYINWSPDFVVVFGSANNFPGSLYAGDVDNLQGAIQVEHPWHAEFDRLVNERSLPSTIEVAFRQGVDASASLALFHKAMTRGFVENDPFARFSIASPRPPKGGGRPLASAEEEARYLNLYASYADAMIAAARRSNQKIAFVWEYHMRDLKGIKPFSSEEDRLYPTAAAKRPLVDIDYDLRTHSEWTKFLNAEGVATVDPLKAIASTNKTVFNDYLHYTANGNDVVAGAVYAQLHDAFVQALSAPKGAAFSAGP